MSDQKITNQNNTTCQNSTAGQNKIYQIIAKILRYNCFGKLSSDELHYISCIKACDFVLLFKGLKEKIAKNYDKAFKLYYDSESFNNPFATHELAVCYEKGRGVKKDIDMAIRLYKKAIRYEVYFSMTNLANYYLLNNDVEKAILLYQRAIYHDDVNAMYNLAMYYKKSKDIKENKDMQSIIIELIKKATTGDLPIATYELGSYYELGFYNIKQDINQAIKLYQHAVNLGDPSAMNALALWYETGQYV